MTVRLLCFCLIPLCGTLIGLELRRKLRVRVESLQMLRRCLSEMKSMIAHNSLSPDGMVKELSRRERDNEWIGLLCQLSSEMPFRDAWRMSLEKCQQRLSLTDRDLECLGDMMQHMGRDDTDGTVALLEMAEGRLDGMMEEAQRKWQTDGKIYAAVGSACGMIAALLVI